MQVSNPNNVKIYNLSAGKSLPEWLTDRRRRTLQKQDGDLRRRISLMQDFEMPVVSNCVQVSKDRQYIFATGVYKPRVRCYDVSQLSMKFERCFDSEVVKLHVLSDDYTKLVFMQADRYIEFHAQHGKYFRIRIPKYGRDMDYHYPSCDMYFVGASSEIYRLNLEQGRFLSSLKSDASELLCCQFNPVHQLFACGTKEGHIECWDPRVRNKVGALDCALGSLVDDPQMNGMPSVTALKFRDGLNLGVGTSTGQVLLYDMRSSKPVLVKDHQYGLPIHSVDFLDSQNLVLSCDSRILKLWDRDSGKPYTSIEPEDTKLNNLCVFPESGMVFLANEAPKILTYYIPSLGAAPKWCSFLDSLTEELEENPMPTVYDDYKFLSQTELESLGLTHLIGTNLLRAYMHGYFIDVRLYKKAKTIAEPFAYEEYRRNKIREKIEEARQNRVQLKKLPKVNRVLAEKLMEYEDTTDKKKKKATPNLMEDDRFSSMFSNPDFQVDTESEEYKLLNPLVSKIDKEREKRQRREALRQQQYEQVTQGEGKESDEDSSDDEHTWTAQVKEQHKLMRQEQKLRERQEQREGASRYKFYELKAGENLGAKSHKKHKLEAKKSLGERLKEEEDSGIINQTGSTGNMELTFTLKKSAKEVQRRQDAKAHHLERKKLRRSAGEITKHRRPQGKFFPGKGLPT